MFNVLYVLVYVNIDDKFTILYNFTMVSTTWGDRAMH